MSMDRSLKIKSALKRHRNVLTRAERIMLLKDEGRWSEEDSVIGLSKVAHRKSHTGRKKSAAAEAASVPLAETEAAETKEEPKT